MVVAFAGALVAGVVGLLWWVVAEHGRADSERAQTIRRVIAGLLAFGMGGMSASFAGIGALVAVILAFVAGVAFVFYSDHVSD